MSLDDVDPLGEVRRALEAMIQPLAGATPVALGWATVDLDRLQRSFEEAYPGSVAETADLAEDVLLGAYCRHLRPGLAGFPAIVLIEPSTEGRLAATLARHGEGPVAVWVTLAAGQPPGEVARTVAAQGPFGTEVLLLDGPIQGPHRLVLLAGTGTITP